VVPLHGRVVEALTAIGARLGRFQRDVPRDEDRASLAAPLAPAGERAPRVCGVVLLAAGLAPKLVAIPLRAVKPIERLCLAAAPTPLHPHPAWRRRCRLAGLLTNL
jgi:hypothetical protein